MSKLVRRFCGILSAIIAYLIVHEGAHLIYALSIDAFKQINFLKLGIQIDVYGEQMSKTQITIFCLVGAIATLIIAYVLVSITDKICKVESKIFKACMYYITSAMLLVDPLYLSILNKFVGGGDMNGIALLIPESLARIIFGIILVINAIVFWKLILPKYKRSFAQ
ncbi:MAG: hypothetical protein GX363_04290 [Clostridiales bacterium]|nr:hypothetical protein [Clostridiales bacterium]